MSLNESWRWTTQEYVIRGKYSNEPVRELLTESQRDRFVFQAYLDAEVPSVVCLSQEVVKYDADANARLGVPSGVKGHLLRIAAELAAVGASATMCVVVDRDYDGTCGVSDSNIELTDLHSLEMYAYDASVLSVLIGRFSGRAHVVDGADLLRRLSPALRWVGALRLELQAATPPRSLPDRWTTDVDCNADPAAVDKVRLLGRIAPVLYAGAGAVQAAVGGIDAAEAAVVGSTSIRGHDFTALLLRLMNSRWGKSVRIDTTLDQNGVEGLLRLVITPEVLARQGLGARLKTRYA